MTVRGVIASISSGSFVVVKYSAHVSVFFLAASKGFFHPTALLLCDSRPKTPR